MKHLPIPRSRKSSLRGFYHILNHFVLYDGPCLVLQSAVTTIAVFQQSATVSWGFLNVSAVPPSQERCGAYGVAS